jgi:PleD family two-component response regulator
MFDSQVDKSEQKILIVDDNPVNLRLLSKMLATQGYNVFSVEDGPQALVEALSISPDLILLDIMMPKMDGYEVCQRLKANEQTRNIPVIFISALSEMEDIIQALTIGGVDYITKPFRAEEVFARVQTHLALQSLQKQLQIANRELAGRNEQLQKRNAELQEALSTIKTISGFVPICAWCHTKIQNEEGEWLELEAFIETHSEAEFTHGICPSCKQRLTDEARALKKTRPLNKS